MNVFLIFGMALIGAFIAALGVAVFRAKRNVFTLTFLLTAVWIAALTIARATVKMWPLWFS